MSVVDVKLQFYRCLFDWLTASGHFSFSSVFDLIDLCSL
jgi:hypothetical protein